ncbi:MAG: formylglycine-generating enzyme family protein [Blastocatellia bacterium]|nr:formylglycine-generating enzyme family protein [Blastocatellia bacterium]
MDLFEEDGFDDLLRAIEFQLKKENRRVPTASAKAAPSIAVPKEEPRIIARPPASLVDRFEMVSLPGGEFVMGANQFDSEKPPHRVRVSAFSIGKYPVTQAQWKAVMGEGNNPSRFQGDDLPVERVSWDDVQEFLKKLGNGFRLPTAAEWEYAARGGTTTAYSFGDDALQLGEYAWFSDNSQGKTHPVGKKRPNPFGLYDVHGNVWEWCSDWYGRDYYKECNKQGVIIDPQGPNSGSSRVARGGGWIILAVLCRSADRGGDSPGRRIGNLGFRLVRVGRIP